MGVKNDQINDFLSRGVQDFIERLAGTDYDFILISRFQVFSGEPSEPGAAPPDRRLILTVPGNGSIAVIQTQTDRSGHVQKHKFRAVCFGNRTRIVQRFDRFRGEVDRYENPSNVDLT